MQARHLLERHFDAEIAAGDHEGVAELDDFLEPLDGLRLFDLGHDAGAALDDLADVDDVLGALHEAERDPVGIGGEAGEQVGVILLGERADRQQRVGQADALLVGELAAIDDFGLDGAAADAGRLELQLAVVEQQAIAHRNALDDFGMGQEDAGDGAGRIGTVEREGLAGDQLHGAIGEAADAQFRALQVDEDAERMAEARLDIADHADGFAHQIVARMAHVDAEHVGAGAGQVLDHLFGVRGGPKRGDNLYASHRLMVVAPLAKIS